MSFKWKIITLMKITQIQKKNTSFYTDFLTLHSQIITPRPGFYHPIAGFVKPGQRQRFNLNLKKILPKKKTPKKLFKNKTKLLIISNSLFGKNSFLDQFKKKILNLHLLHTSLLLKELTPLFQSTIPK
jgi:hypothetical protein